MKNKFLAFLTCSALSLSLVSPALAIPAAGPGTTSQDNAANTGWVIDTPPTAGGSNGGGGSYNDDYTPPSNPSYTVGDNKGEADNGSWSTDKTSAKAGDTVTITVAAKDGYQGVPKVTDSKGGVVAVKDAGDGKFTFVMPASRVTISVEFEPVVISNPFVDVQPGDYYDAILWAVANGITQGTTPTTFSPSQGCTRAQIVTFLYRAAGEPALASQANPFEDNQPGSYYNAILWAVANGITEGTSETTFSPSQTCTRAQAVTFLWRAAGKPEPTSTTSPFTDVADPGAYYYNAVLWAVEKGITKGTSDTTFSPDQTCTRAQIVTFLYRDRVN